jgi:hypothetical protein
MIKFTKIHDVQIFMKSGNSFVLDKVHELSMDYTGGSVSSFKLNQSVRAKSKLMVQTIELSQIEAVIHSKPSYTLFY